ncbi:hypothetical protein B0T26DRAFT_177781 [Lasiosphaeria miniovina]|uniref:Uncharacterized protein n=1 Tax=Lasiosphaeria miniovina TaxID=1954250 RepID=A0AA40E554_9PEZI|nr:uncharacterized protein B0T26DRAFT_177781 [Lasiosphaeria miniovina]KAK0728584.1 hypothetical protein B0T26DRAFT_177781 [Lasiosphaeria miniovina]
MEARASRLFWAQVWSSTCEMASKKPISLSASGIGLWENVGRGRRVQNSGPSNQGKMKIGQSGRRAKGEGVKEGKVKEGEHREEDICEQVHTVGSFTLQPGAARTARPPLSTAESSFLQNHGTDCMRAMQPKEERASSVNRKIASSQPLPPSGWKASRLLGRGCATTQLEHFWTGHAPITNSMPVICTSSQPTCTWNTTWPRRCSKRENGPFLAGKSRRF